MLRCLIIVLAACGGAKPEVAPPTNRPVEPSRPRAEDSPYKSATWIKKLDDPKERQRAIVELEQLGDPAAIEPLGKVWIEERDPRVLQVVIALARPLTPADAKARFFTEYETTGRPANWKRAAPFLLRAVNDLDDSNARSVDAAAKAA